MAVVYLNARAGTLHCSYNNLIAENLMAGTPNEYAFSAPSGADITILYNTSGALCGSPASPFSGSVISPPIGHDGSNYILSNTDFYTGSY